MLGTLGIKVMINRVTKLTMLGRICGQWGDSWPTLGFVDLTGNTSACRS